MSKKLACFVIFLSLFFGGWVPDLSAQGGCTGNWAQGPCGDGCSCWSLTMTCTSRGPFGELIGVTCTSSGGFCDYGEVTIVWTNGPTCD